MYSEITKEMFLAVVDRDAITFNNIHKEHFFSYCVSSKYNVTLKVVNNYVSAVTQYYIIDINA